MARRVDHAAHGFVRLRGVIHIDVRQRAFLGARLDAAVGHAALDRAAVAAARHHFLAGIAALGEAHALDQFQVDGLRNEQVLGGGADPGDAGGQVGRAPGVGVCPRQRAGQGGGAGQLRVRGDPPPAPFAGRRGRGDPGARRQLGAFPGLARQRPAAASSAASWASLAARTPQACSAVAASLALARSTNMDRRLSKACDRSRAAAYSCGASSPAPGRRATSAAWPAAGPGGAVAGQAGGVGRQAGDVLGQLAVQESQRIGARGGNDQEIVQRAQAAQPSALDGIEARKSCMAACLVAARAGWGRIASSKIR